MKHRDTYRSLVEEFLERGEPLIPFPLGFPHDDFEAFLAELAACSRGEGSAVDDVVDGGSGRKLEFGPVVFKVPADLLGPVVSEGSPNFEDRFSNIRRSGPWATSRRAAAVL